MGVFEMSKLFSDFQMSCWTVFKCPVDKILECTLLHQKDILENLLEDSFSKVFGGKYFPGNHLKNSLRDFLENNFKSFLRDFFWKTILNLPWGNFFKTTPNLLWGIFLANNLKSSLRDFFGKQPQIFLEGLFWKRTWYRPWGRGRRTFWPLISGIGSGLLVLLKINWLQSHFRNSLWFVGSPEKVVTTVLNIVVA